MQPEISEKTYIDKSSVIIGNVIIASKCGILPNSVIRGDQNIIKIDEGSNVQDCAVIHTDLKHQVNIGKNVSIGHSAVVHGATIEDNVIVGMNATIMNGSKIGHGSIIGANALVSENKEIPPFSLVVGIPGKIIKTNEEFETMCIKNAETYHRLTKEHLLGKHKHYSP